MIDPDDRATEAAEREADAVQRRALAAEREAEAAELYAPPAEDPIALQPRPQPPAMPPSPVLIGFVTLLITCTLSSIIAGGMMALWYNLTPIGGGFLAGLGEWLMAFFSWAALTAFAVLGGICFAAGILGREGKVSTAGWVVSVLLGIGAIAVCFLPEPESTFATRGMFGVFTLAASVGMTLGALSYARRKWYGPPPPPPWMAS